MTSGRRRGGWPSTLTSARVRAVEQEQEVGRADRGGDDPDRQGDRQEVLRDHVRAEQEERAERRR